MSREQQTDQYVWLLISVASSICARVPCFENQPISSSQVQRGVPAPIQAAPTTACCEQQWKPSGNTLALQQSKAALKQCQCMTFAHTCSSLDLMAEGIATAVPNARLSGSKRKKVLGNSSRTWDSYLHKVLQDSHPGLDITKEAGCRCGLKPLAPGYNSLPRS